MVRIVFVSIYLRPGTCVPESEAPFFLLLLSGSVCVYLKNRE